VAVSPTSGGHRSFIPANLACRRCPSGVHSTNSTSATNSGRTHAHSFIFSAVRPSPHRPERALGRFANGHREISKGRSWSVNHSRVIGVFRSHSATNDSDIRLQPATQHRVSPANMPTPSGGSRHGRSVGLPKLRRLEPALNRSTIAHLKLRRLDKLSRPLRFEAKR
jgi:hypothetical protein